MKSRENSLFFHIAIPFLKTEYNSMLIHIIRLPNRITYSRMIVAKPLVRDLGSVQGIENSP